MGWLSRTINSSIGKKAVMAVSGLLLALFVFGHLLGNSNAFRGRTAYQAYATGLHSLGGALLVAEILLLAVFMIHIGFGLTLFLENRQARPRGYSRRGSAPGRTAGSMTMPYTGIIILLFLILHLAGFRFTAAASASSLVRDNLSRPLTAGFYIVALAALTLHLSHGLWSLCQSLGASHPKYDRFLEYGALVLSIFTGTAFIMIPVLVLFWPGFLS